MSTMSTLEEVMSNQEVVTQLTRNQVDLLIQVALGKTNAQIAHDLNLHEQTIKNRINMLMKKLHAANRVHIATFACLGHPPTETQLRVHWRDLDRGTGTR